MKKLCQPSSALYGVQRFNSKAKHGSVYLNIPATTLQRPLVVPQQQFATFRALQRHVLFVGFVYRRYSL
jgi:hypothetical protein